MAADDSTQRVEAFSDGIFAFAATLLVLDIHVPHVSPADNPVSFNLMTALLSQWPAYFTYGLSFLFIGIYWANHHYVFKLYQRTDHLFLLLNVIFLMTIAVLPFPTAILAEYVEVKAQQQHAVVAYTVAFMLPSIVWLGTWLYATNGNRLIDITLDPGFVQRLTAKFVVSNVLYALTIVVAFVQPLLALAINLALSLSYLLPPESPKYTVEKLSG